MRPNNKFSWKAAFHSTLAVAVSILIPVGLSALLGFEQSWNAVGWASLGGYLVSNYLLWKRDFFNEEE